MAWAMFPDTGELANACYNAYETSDGEWLALGALEPKFWTGFCERIARPDLAALQHAEGDERARVVQEVRGIMRSRTRDEWLAHFADADVCLTAIYTPEEVASDPHVAARDEVFTVRLTADVASTVRLKPDTTSAAPALGADTDALLEEAGVSAEQRARLRTAGVI
jgi:alpha-methylacyl-CoA racemase